MPMEWFQPIKMYIKLLMVCFMFPVFLFADSAIVDKPNLIDCKMDLTTLQKKSNVKLSVGNKMYFVGYIQKSKNNQNPVVIAFSGNSKIYCNDSLETSNDDGKAYGVVSIDDRLFILLTSTGTQGKPNSDYRRFTKFGWLKDYGKGGGAKVTVLTELEIGSGKPIRGSFLRAESSNGKTNSFLVTEMKKSGDNFQLDGLSWFSPLGINKKPLTCKGKSPFQVSLLLNSNLTSAIEVKSPSCQ